MNILLASEYFFGNPDFVRLAKELARRNHKVNVATSFRPVDRHTETETNFEIFEINPLVTIYKIPHTLSFPISKVRQIFRKQNIDVVHTINDHSTNGAVACVVAKASGTPFVYTIQGPGTKTGHPLVDFVSQVYTLTAGRWFAMEAGKVVLLSQSLISTVEKLKIDKAKIAIIPSGVDSSRFDRERPEVKEKASLLRDEFQISDEIVIGYTGRLFPAKGLAYLFSAVKMIQDKNPNIALLVVGDGAQRSELEMMAKDLNIRTIFAGWQRDTPPYYSLMDIFVLPSLFEGLPNVILEAMAMKTAVVATNVGGNPDVLSNGENGFLVPARNSSKLASALQTLIEDSDLRNRMGANNRRKVEKNFQWSKTVEKVERVYREIT